MIVELISVGTEIRRICNKYLVNNIVKCAHKKRDDAGNGIFAH